MSKHVIILNLFLAAFLSAVPFNGLVQADLIVYYNMEQESSPLIDQVGGDTAQESGFGHNYAVMAPSGNAVGLKENGSWRLDVAESTKLNELTNDFTAAAWIYLDSSIVKAGPNSNNNRIIGDDDAWDADAWSFGVRDNKLLFTKNGLIDAFGTEHLAQDQWVHVAAVISSTSGIVFYINGVYDDTVTNIANINIGDDAFGIGRSYGDGQGQWFAGSFDEVRVYDTVLDDAVIADLAYSDVTFPVRLLNPSDASVNVPVSAEPTLKWLSGTDPNIIQHVLYFSTDENWVNTALPDDEDAIVVDVAIEAYQHFENLANETTYFWRVDEAAGNLDDLSNVETGPVWSFTTRSAPQPLCAGFQYNGDIDGNCFVDLRDVLLLAQDWMLASIISEADINNDANVDYTDFAYIGRDWLSEIEKPNMLFIHAHPDDEGIFGGGVLPYYAQARDMSVTSLAMTTRNPDGSYPMSRSSADRMQMLRNAMDIYAGQPTGTGTFNEFGHYITGNITHVESGLVATSCCDPDPLRTWSQADDGKAWGIASYVTEETPGYGNMEGMSDGRLAGAWIIAREIRRFQPEVVVSVHDLEGDYGHENHSASTIALIEAFDLAADSGVNIDGLEPWQVSKVYIRGGASDNRNSIAWDNFTSDGGINSLFHDFMEETMISGQSPRTIADQGLDEHVSEGRPDVSTVFRASENFNGHHSEWWTLYRSIVGADTTTTFTVSGDTTNSTYNGWARGDFFENIGSTD